MAGTFEIWIGAYSSTEDVGITRLTLDADAVKLTKEAEFTGIENPSFLTMDRTGKYLHAVSEVKTLNGQPGGEIITFLIEEGEAGFELQEAMSHPTLGADPCFLMLDPSEQWLAVANYHGASAVVFPIDPSGVPGPIHVRFRHSGTGPNEQRQEAPHPHAAVFSPDGRFLYITDLGMDKIMVYTLNEEGQWAVHDAVNLEPGAGPRHMKFHPSGRYVYVINELDNTITRFDYDAQDGKLTKQESVPSLPPSFTGENYTAEIVVSPDGRFVYGSNRGHDSIAIFAADEATGVLSPAGFVSTRGKTPRNFAITPDGEWLLAANQDSDSLVLFRIDAATGLPIYAGVEVAIRKPVCVYIRR